MALDLGTAFVRLATEKPGAAAISKALTPGTLIREGVIADNRAAANLLRPNLNRARRIGLPKPRIFAGFPTIATRKVRTALSTALHMAAAVTVVIVPEPRAAAIGAGLVLSSPYAQMIMDVGDGATDCTVIRAGEIVASQPKRISESHSLVETRIQRAASP